MGALLGANRTVAVLTFAGWSVQLPYPLPGEADTRDEGSFGGTFIQSKKCVRFGADGVSPASVGHFSDIPTGKVRYRPRHLLNRGRIGMWRAFPFGPRIEVPGR